MTINANELLYSTWHQYKGGRPNLVWGGFRKGNMAGVARSSAPSF